MGLSNSVIFPIGDRVVSENFNGTLYFKMLTGSRITLHMTSPRVCTLVKISQAIRVRN